MLIHMVRKQLYIDEDLDRGLKALAARTGRPEAEHVRLALRRYLDQEPSDAGADPLLDLIGLVADADGPDDVALHHDDYLYGSRRPA